MPDHPSQVFFKVEGHHLEIDIQDFDRDGIPEIAVTYHCGAHTMGFRLFRIRRPGEISMVPGTDIGSDWPSIEWGDFDHDGYFEIINRHRNWDKIPTRDMVQERHIWDGNKYYLESSELINGMDEDDSLSSEKL